MAESKLQHKWVLFAHFKQKKGKGGAAGRDREKEWRESIFKVCEFDTVEDFWRYWNNIPKASQFFSVCDARPRLQGKDVEALSLFKEGIQPMWEDEANKSGGEFTLRKFFPPVALDTFWNNLVMGMVGETLEDKDEICGGRIVDKGSKDRPMFRFELWMRGKSEAMKMRVKGKMEKIVLEDLKGSIKLDSKDH